MINLEHYRNFSWNFLEIWNIIKQIRNKMFHNYDPPPFKIYKTHIILPVNLMSKDIRIGERIYTPDFPSSRGWELSRLGKRLFEVSGGLDMLRMMTMMTREYDQY